MADRESGSACTNNNTTNTDKTSGFRGKNKSAEDRTETMVNDHDSESLATNNRCDGPRFNPDNDKKVRAIRLPGVSCGSWVCLLVDNIILGLESLCLWMSMFVGLTSYNSMQ